MMVGVWLASLLLHGGSASYVPVIMFLFQHFLDTVVVFFPRWRSSNPDSLAPSATLPFPCRPTRRNLDVRRTRLSASIATAGLLFSGPRRNIQPGRILLHPGPSASALRAHIRLVPAAAASPAIVRSLTLGNPPLRVRLRLRSFVGIVPALRLEAGEVRLALPGPFAQDGFAVLLLLFAVSRRITS